MRFNELIPNEASDQVGLACSRTPLNTPDNTTMI